MRILAISGSLRSGSHNTELLRAAAAAAPDGSRGRALRRPEGDPAVRRRRRRPGPTSPRAVGASRTRSRGRTPCSSRRPSTTRPSRACSRTRSTGSRARSLESPVRNKPVAVISSSTGMFGGVWARRRPRRCSAPSAPACSRTRSRCRRRDERLADGVDADAPRRARSVVAALAAAVEARAAACRLGGEEALDGARPSRRARPRAPCGRPGPARPAAGRRARRGARRAGGRRGGTTSRRARAASGRGRARTPAAAALISP